MPPAREEKRMRGRSMSVKQRTTLLALLWVIVNCDNLLALGSEPTIPNSDLASKPAAVVAGAPISVAEVDQLAENKLIRLRTQEYDIKRLVLNDLIAQIMLK